MYTKDFIHSVFSRVAGRYDLMNDLMSFGLHRIWKRHFVSSLALKPDMSILDVAAGTGDIAALIIKELQARKLPYQLTAVDPNPDMAAQGQAKLMDAGVVPVPDWIIAPAEDLPFEEASQDLYTIAFGLRNVTDRERALREAFRVLKPGGQFVCLEFSHVENEMLKGIYKAYSEFLIPKMGKWVANDEEAYAYLVDSIQKFPDQETLKHMMEQAGFTAVSFENLSKGVIAIHRGWKP